MPCLAQNESSSQTLGIRTPFHPSKQAGWHGWHMLHGETFHLVISGSALLCFNAYPSFAHNYPYNAYAISASSLRQQQQQPKQHHPPPRRASEQQQRCTQMLRMKSALAWQIIWPTHFAKAQHGAPLQIAARRVAAKGTTTISPPPAPNSII